MHIAIYHDKGVSSGALEQLLKALDHPLFDPYILKRVDRHFFKERSWEQNLALLIFPGGRDLPYHEALQGSANQSIRNYVADGGRYLGLCAGGYYGCGSIEFARGELHEIIASRELAFFPGRALGPSFLPFQYHSELGARSISIQWEGRTSQVYYNGGCSFPEAHLHNQTEILASYTDLPFNPPAVILSHFGRGKALLSGVHPEYNPDEPFWPYLINKILT